MDDRVRPGRWHPYPSIFRPIKKWTDRGAAIHFPSSVRMCKPFSVFDAPPGVKNVRPVFCLHRPPGVKNVQFIFRLQSEGATHFLSSLPTRSRKCATHFLSALPPRIKIVQPILCLHCAPEANCATHFLSSLAPRIQNTATRLLPGRMTITSPAAHIIFDFFVWNRFFHDQVTPRRRYMLPSNYFFRIIFFEIFRIIFSNCP